MKQLLSAIIILTLLSSCGIKRPLETPCHIKRHKTEDGSAQPSGNSTNSQQPDNQPCPAQQVDANGQILMTPPPPAQNNPAQGTPGQR